jgi:hypothetical protein
MFMVSREMGSWPLGVILTVRSAVFICGETEEMVPWMMVPGTKLAGSSRMATDSTTGVESRRPSNRMVRKGVVCHTIFQLNRHRLVGALHQESAVARVSIRVPVHWGAKSS